MNDCKMTAALAIQILPSMLQIRVVRSASMSKYNCQLDISSDSIPLSTSQRLQLRTFSL